VILYGMRGHEARSNRVRGKSKFASRFNGESGVQSSAQKYLSSDLQKYVICSGHPASIEEGRMRIVTTREAGMRWTRWSRQTSVASADGEVVWS
jgi:hypothetical protein